MTVCLIKVKSCNLLLHVLLLCICSYLNSVLRYEFLIVYTYCLDTLYLHEQGYEDPWLFFKARRGLQAKNVWKTLFQRKRKCILCYVAVSKESVTLNFQHILFEETDCYGRDLYNSVILHH